MEISFNSLLLSQKDGWAEWLRLLEPFDWFTTLTFKKDIQTFRRENPSRHIERYEWKDSTEKYPNGTYVRVGSELSLEKCASDWSNKISYNKSSQERFARAQYLVWLRKLNEAVYGRRFREQKLGIDNAYGMEFQKRGVIHIHAIMKGIPKEVSMYEWAKKWWGQHSNNGYATIEPYNPQLGAVGYLGKYIVKGGQVDLWLNQKTLAQLRQIVCFYNS